MAEPAQMPAVRNRLLAALPPAVLDQLLPKLHRVSLTLRQTLHTPARPIQAVHFVEEGWVSMVAHLDEGAQAEVGLIGREGMVGQALVSGVNTAFADAYVQAPGEALQMDAATFQQELETQPALLQRVLRYTEAMHAQTMQTAACNGRHQIEQRLARWLLMAHDRADSDSLPMTQEFLALMLCVQRPSITTVARTLQKAGVIQYSQGRVTVLDREGLEATACDCYRVVRERFSQLLR